MRNVVFVVFNDESDMALIDFSVVCLDTRSVLKKGRSVKALYESMCAFKVGKMISNLDAQTTRDVLRKFGLKLSSHKFVDTLWEFIEFSEAKDVPINHLLYLDNMLYCYKGDMKITSKLMVDICIRYADAGYIGSAVLDNIIMRTLKSFSDVNRSIHCSDFLLQNCYNYLRNIIPYSDTYKHLLDELPDSNAIKDTSVMRFHMLCACSKLNANTTISDSFAYSCCYKYLFDTTHKAVLFKLLKGVSYTSKHASDCVNRVLYSTLDVTSLPIYNELLEEFSNESVDMILHDASLLYYFDGFMSVKDYDEHNVYALDFCKLPLSKFLSKCIINETKG